ncbi:MAG: pentapeptide repeat-containing protein [Candidatus Omnitrophica bacterium]|nr:pentapeptide repeat-containing protein [Candidatus Omnitrophota bacterium]
MHKSCKELSCKETALSLSDYCWQHIPDKKAHVSRLKEDTKDKKSMKGFNLKGIHAHSIDLSRADLKGANLSNADFKGANFSDANLTDANLIGSDISECEFIGAECNRANFMMANLSKSRFWHADMKNADFAECNLQAADMLSASLAGSNLYHADLRDVKFLIKENFTGKGGKEYINEEGPKTARESYANLKQYFITAARFNDVSWASYNESRMELRRLWKEKRAGVVPFLVMGLLCGWGERPLRATVSAFSIITGYASVFYFSKAIYPTFSQTYQPTFLDMIYYSTITFTTVGYGDFLPRLDNPVYKFLAGSEAFIGIFMMGLFVFSLGRRYSTR